MRKTRKCVKGRRKSGKTYGKKYGQTKKHRGGGFFDKTYYIEKNIYKLLPEDFKRTYCRGMSIKTHPGTYKCKMSKKIYDKMMLKIGKNINRQDRNRQDRNRQENINNKKKAAAEKVFRDCMDSTDMRGRALRSTLGICSLRADVSAGTAEYPTNTSKYAWPSRQLSDATIEKYKYDGKYPLDLKAKSHEIINYDNSYDNEGDH